MIKKMPRAIRENLRGSWKMYILLKDVVKGCV